MEVVKEQGCIYGKKTDNIKYGKPCMTNLPPELGRMIINAIMNPPPFDRTALNKKAARAKYRLRQIISEINRNETAAK